MNLSATRYRKIDSIKASPENSLLYNGIDESDSTFVNLVESILEFGINDPIILSIDLFVLSGHRRLEAAKRAGLKSVPTRIRSDVSRDIMDHSEYIKILLGYNDSQRNKTAGERLREHMARVDPNEAIQQITAARNPKRRQIGQVIKDVGVIRRAQIGPNKKEFLSAVETIVEKLLVDGPMSERAIHYNLLSDPPLTNSSVGSQRHRYANDRRSERALSDLVTRARIIGTIPMYAIIDETRPETIWDTHRSADEYVSDVLGNFGANYCRDLMIDQPNHIEIIAEKLTVKSYVSNVAMKYCIPVTTARGKCSLPPRANVVERWQRSGKKKLVLIVMADWDPDGIVVCNMWKRSLIGDLGVDERLLKVVRAGINKNHAKKFDIPVSLDANENSPTYQEFVAKYGTHAYELEALSPDQMQQVLTDAIESEIDRSAYEQQVALEKLDAQRLIAIRHELSEIAAAHLDELE